MLTFLRTYNKPIYIALLSILTLCLLCDYIPALVVLSSWVTPPVALFLGLVFALTCGQAYPTFNKTAYAHASYTELSTRRGRCPRYEDYAK